MIITLVNNQTEGGMQSLDNKIKAKDANKCNLDDHLG